MDPLAAVPRSHGGRVFARPHRARRVRPPPMLVRPTGLLRQWQEFGIWDINKPDRGEPGEIRRGEVLVFGGFRVFPPGRRPRPPPRPTSADQSGGLPDCGDCALARHGAGDAKGRWLQRLWD